MTGPGNGCNIKDTFCVTFIDKDPCDDIEIDFDCGDENLDLSKCFEGNDTDHDTKYICLSNLPEVCDDCDGESSYSWQISPVQGVPTTEPVAGEFICCELDGINYWVSIFPSELEPGEYKITVDFSGNRICECEDLVQYFTIDKGNSKDLLKNVYCSGEEVRMGDTLIPAQNWCVRWKIKDEDIYRVIQWGIFEDNKVLNYSSTGNYLAEIYDCLRDTIIEYNYFTILDCTKPLTDKLNVEEIICSDDDRRLQLDMKPDAMLDKSMVYDIWTLTEDSLKNYLIYRDKVYYGIPSYIYYIPSGLYLMEMTNFFGQVDSMYVRINDYHRLPAELIYRQNFDLSDDPITVDAGINVIYDADYVWTREAIVVSTSPTIEITSEGVYKVNVSTKDCSRSDSIIVTRLAAPLTSVFDNRSNRIDMQFTNPAPVNKQQDIFIVNETEQEYVNLEVYTISGKMVYDHIKDFNLKINFKKPGIYFIRATNSQGENIVKKLIIQ